MKRVDAEALLAGMEEHGCAPSDTQALRDALGASLARERHAILLLRAFREREANRFIRSGIDGVLHAMSALPVEQQQQGRAPSDVISRIKRIREATACGLKEAKDAIEAAGYDEAKAIAALGGARG